jgi:hypothetical protein
MRITRYTTIVDHRCNIDGALNHVDGNIDMIVYKVDGPRSNFGEYHQSHRWGTQKTSKPNETDNPKNIDIEVVNNIVDWCFFRGVTRSDHYIEAFSARERV